MPLTEHERRQLALIEAQLRESSPRLSRLLAGAAATRTGPLAWARRLVPAHGLVARLEERWNARMAAQYGDGYFRR